MAFFAERTKKMSLTEQRNEKIEKSNLGFNN